MAKVNHPPAFLFYPDDFSSDGKVEAMTTEEVGAYILLLCKSWREKPPGSLPSDDPTLARWARLTLDRWLGCRPGVLAAYTFGTDSRWHQKRQRQEYDKLLSFRKSRQSAAVSMWEKKKLHARALHVQCIPSSSSFPSKEKEGKTNTAPDGAPGIVPVHIWVSFVEMRRKNKKPLSDYAEELIRRKLQAFKDAGEDPVEIIEQSIMNSWSGVFSLKKRGEVHGQKGKPTTSEVVQSFLGHARKISLN